MRKEKEEFFKILDNLVENVEQEPTYKPTYEHTTEEDLVPIARDIQIRAPLVYEDVCALVRDETECILNERCTDAMRRIVFDALWNAVFSNGD